MQRHRVKSTSWTEAVDCVGSELKPDGKTCRVWMRRTAVVLVVVKVAVVPVKVEFSAVQVSIKIKLLLLLLLLLSLFV